jgi:hypothetical protein
MPMKWPAKLFLVLAILVGLYYGTDRKDHDRWLAALGVSGTSAGKLRAETQRERYLAERAAEQARWRGATQASDDTAAGSGVPLGRDEICAGIQERESLLRAQGKEPDAAMLKMKIFCADEHLRAQ